ncbi:MAG: hypothetical protein ABI120_18155, partial [Gemmatimonadaceae bacterium]
MFLTVPELIVRALNAKAVDDLRTALELLERAERLDPFDVTVLSLLGSFYQQRELSAQADEAFRRLLKIEPHHAAARSAYARVFG